MFKKKVYLKNLQVKRKYFDKIATRLGIEKQEDWYYFGPTTLYKIGEKNLAARLKNSLSTHVQSVYTGSLDINVGLVFSL